MREKNQEREREREKINVFYTHALKKMYKYFKLIIYCT